MSIPDLKALAAFHHREAVRAEERAAAFGQSAQVDDQHDALNLAYWHRKQSEQLNELAAAFTVLVSLTSR